MQGDRLDAVRRGTRAFLDGMKPSDEAMLALFSDRLLRYTPFTSDKKELDAVIASTQAAGGTAVNDFLYLSLKLLDARQGQRVVVLFSDGSDVHSVLPAADVLWKARAGQSLIYWIQLGGKHQSFTSAWRDFKGNDREFTELEKAVRESGGRTLSIERDRGPGGGLPQHPPGAPPAVRPRLLPDHRQGGRELAQGRGPAARRRRPGADPRRVRGLLGKKEHGRARTDTDEHGPVDERVRVRPCQSVFVRVLFPPLDPHAT